MRNDIEVTSIREEHIVGYHGCIDSVARERRFIGGVQARPIESTREFALSNIKNGYPHFVALDGDKIVGWCDIIPMKGVDFSHCGLMGMGLLVDYRRQGIGTRLLDTTIQAAEEYGLERVELEVYTSNTPAIRLYEKRGFIPEGVKRKARKLDGEYFDIQVMALFINP
jgi:ribosomal protein S18 acetylase RimI-like enzyme